ncbi:MFS transporter [Sphingobacterium faecale]|uniref:MFS transporter n=1 Tax=Sphingobacterium faecale TaxID=2803775 RepID=A0ABS1R1Z0_9SPHI|nr:MFS transporter [Sphingobacterium faecale]MBL1408724.1 MFS transporter [Sphingobacterium faecale]
MSKENLLFGAESILKNLGKPENRRWGIVTILFIAIVFNYVDRQLVSVLKPILKVEFSLDDSGYAFIVNIFTVCYATMYPITGWLVDKFGSKKVLFWGVLTWSIACIGGGISKTVSQFGFFRGMLGVAEPTVFPAQLKAVTVWFPGKLRATANGLCQAGGSIGAIVAPFLVAWLALSYSWHTAFIVMGVVGILIAILWRIVYKDPPAYIQQEALQSTVSDDINGFSWKELWKRKSLWGVIMVRFVSDPVWYFCLFWLPGYLQEESGLSLAQIGMFGWIPFLIADVGAVGTSMLSDKIVRKGSSPLLARKRMLLMITFFSSLCVFTPYLDSAAATIVVFSVVALVCVSWLFTMGVIIAESFPVKNVASVQGIAGGFGALGAVIFNYFVGQLMGSYGSEKIFLVMAFLHPLALLMVWVFIKPERPNTG